MKYNFDQTIDRRNTKSYKWDGNKKFFGRDDVLPFWVADMDFPCAKPIVDALKQRVSHQCYGYTMRSESYSEAIIQWLKKRHRWNIDGEWLTFCPPGLVQAINILIRLLSKPGDGIILQKPSYKPLIDVIINNRCRLRNNPLRLKEGNYFMDFENLRRIIDPGTKLLLLCSPHNPTGRVWTRGELTRLAEICQNNNLTVISDEIHADIVYQGHQHIPYGSISREAAMNSITCFSAGKTFNISGLPQSTIIIPNPEIRRSFLDYLDTAQITLGNIFGEVALEAGYRHCEDWLEQVIQYLQGNLDTLVNFFDSQLPGITVIRPQGTFLAWLDFRTYLERNNISATDLKDILINRAKVVLYDGQIFGPEGEGFFRMNFACSRSLLDEGLEQVKQALKVSIKL